MHKETIEARGAVSGGAATSAVSAGVARVPAPPDLDFELLASDGEPLETYWHHLEIGLMADVVTTAMEARGRRNFFIGGNMFVYYDPQQARGIATDPGTREHYKGPDIFFVSGVEPGIRDFWVTWVEGRYPEVIIELISPSTERKDREANKELYERTFRTPEYFLYDPAKEKLEGFRLRADRYREIPSTAEGRLWSEQLEAYLGLWYGDYQRMAGTWVRLFDRRGRLLPRAEEAERQRAQLAEQRAEEAEAKLAALEARLGDSGSGS